MTHRHIHTGLFMAFMCALFLSGCIVDDTASIHVYNDTDRRIRVYYEDDTGSSNNSQDNTAPANQDSTLSTKADISPGKHKDLSVKPSGTHCILNVVYGGMVKRYSIDVGWFLPSGSQRIRISDFR